MIALVGASAIFLMALQATISGPTNAFRGCLRQASEKAASEKVAPDAIDAYLRSACTAQLQSLKGAVVAFRLKNGMAKKAASDDANMTVEDYLATPVEKYQFLADFNAKKPAAATATPAPTAAAATTQPPKP